MKNFKTLAVIDVSFIKEEIEANSFLWPHYRFRSEYPGSAHEDTDCILLRNQPNPNTVEANNITDCVWNSNLEYFPVIEDLLEDIKESFSISEFGRIMLVSLYPQGVISEHIDEGNYSDNYSRMHLSIVSREGNVFYCGSDSKHIQEGELCWFNHKVAHKVINNSDSERIHLIIDYK